MKVLSMSDIYQVRSSYHLEMEDQRVLLQLYQPLIGHESTILYLTLFSELNQLTLTKKPALISRLCKITGFSVSSLTQAITKLEAVGLISTYVKHQDNRYLFDLKMPLSANQFMKHKILNTLLSQRLHDEYDKTVIAFQTYNVDLNQYEDISSSFTDVFDIQLQSNQVLQEKEYRKKVHNIIEDSYDMTLFYQSMESLQLSRKMLTQDNIKLIQQLGILYKINALDMLDMVKQNMNNDHLDEQSLISNCRHYYDLKMPQKFEEIFHKQSVLLQQNQGKSDLDKHIYYLENISPYDLLKDKLGGREPLKRDLQVIESVLTDLQLEPGVMNALIELTLYKCNQSLPRNFIEAIASQWKRKNISTVKDAIAEGKAYIQYSKENSEDQWFHHEQIEADSQDVQEANQDLMNMLNSLYE